MTPLPAPLWIVGGLALGVLGLHALARFARAGRGTSGWRWLVLGVLALAVGIDALGVFAQRTGESAGPLRPWMTVALVALFALGRLRELWRGLGAPAAPPPPPRR